MWGTRRVPRGGPCRVSYGEYEVGVIGGCFWVVMGKCIIFINQFVGAFIYIFTDQFVF